MRRYTPGDRKRASQSPAESDLIVRRSPVSTLVSVTVAPAIDAPDGSATRPVNPVLAPVCARTGVIIIAKTILTKPRAIRRDTLLPIISASYCLLKIWNGKYGFDCYFYRGWYVYQGPAKNQLNTG